MMPLFHLETRVMAALAMLLSAALTGSAGAQVVAASDFDDGPQGWTFDVAARWRLATGNPGGCLENFEEPTNGPAWAMAAPAFLGDWTALDSRGVLRFDHRRVSNGGGAALSFIPIIVEVSGPGGTARWESELLPLPGEWRTFEIPIRREVWNVESAAIWTAILSNVTRVRFFLEQVSNTLSPEDLNLLDNVVLTGRCAADFNGDGHLDPDDLADYIGAFFAVPPASGSDFNGDGTTDPDDLADFIGAFFSGCP